MVRPAIMPSPYLMPSALRAPLSDLQPPGLLSHLCIHPIGEGDPGDNDAPPRLVGEVEPLGHLSLGGNGSTMKVKERCWLYCLGGWIQKIPDYRIRDHASQARSPLLKEITTTDLSAADGEEHRPSRVGVLQLGLVVLNGLGEEGAVPGLDDGGLVPQDALPDGA